MNYLNLLILLLVLFAAGCGKNSGDGKSGKNKTAEEKESISLPSDYPSEFQKPQDSKVLSVNIFNDGTIVMFQTETPPAQLIDAYRKTALENGYEEQTGTNGQPSNSAVFVRMKDKRNVSVSISSGKSGKNTVSFIYK